MWDVSQNGNLAVLVPKFKRAPVYPQPQCRRFRSPDEFRYFTSYCDKTAKHLGGYYDPVLWSRINLQASEQEPSIRHAVIAIGALEMTKSRVMGSSAEKPRHRFKSKKVAKLAAIPKESAHRHHVFALQQYSKAIKEMREAIFTRMNDLRSALVASILIVCFEIYHGNHEAAAKQVHTSMKVLENWKASEPAPSAIEDDLIYAFDRLDRLDIQTMSNGDQYSLEEHFRFKDVGTSVVENMPAKFTNVLEARACFNIIVRCVVHFARILKYGDGSNVSLDGEVDFNDQGLLIHHQRFLTEAERWMDAFKPLFDGSRDPTGNNFCAASTLRMHYIIVYTELRNALYDNKMFSDNNLDLYIEIVDLVKGLLEGDNSVFSFDLQSSWPLYIMATKCRDPKFRREAIHLLASKPRREGVWDSMAAAKVCEWVVGIEEEGMVDGFVPEWFRVKKLKVDIDVETRKAHVECEQARIVGETKKHQATISW